MIHNFFLNFFLFSCQSEWKCSYFVPKFSTIVQMQNAENVLICWLFSGFAHIAEKRRGQEENNSEHLHFPLFQQLSSFKLKIKQAVTIVFYNTSFNKSYCEKPYKKRLNKSFFFSLDFCVWFNCSCFAFRLLVKLV